MRVFESLSVVESLWEYLRVFESFSVFESLVNFLVILEAERVFSLVFKTYRITRCRSLRVEGGIAVLARLKRI